MAAQQTAQQTTQQVSNKRENRLLVIIIFIPIIIALLIGGGPAILKGILTICKYVVPNFWVVLVYVWVALIAFLIGRMTKRR